MLEWGEIHLGSIYLPCLCLSAPSAHCVPMMLRDEPRRNKSSQNYSQVRNQLLLSAGCSSAMTSILPDVSVEIRIFLKKDTSHRKGFRLISLSRSNRPSLMFGCTSMKVAGLEMCWRIAMPGSFSRCVSCSVVYLCFIICIVMVIVSSTGKLQVTKKEVDCFFPLLYSSTYPFVILPF